MTAYIELHSCSAFSFLEGASLPEHLAEEAARLEYPALALIDRDGFCGAPRFYKACRAVGVRPLVGAQITISGSGSAYGYQLPLLVENQQGYQNLSRLITQMKLRSEKGKGELHLQELEDNNSGVVCLTGGENGLLRGVLQQQGPETASKCLQRLKDLFGRQSVYVELQRHLDRREETINRFLIELASQHQLPLLATNGVRYSGAERRPLLDVLTCIRHKTDLDSAGTILSRNAECYLKEPNQMQQLFQDLPEPLAQSVELAQRLDFTLKDLGYRFPGYPVPEGHSMMSYLRELTQEGARRRYRPYHRRARDQIAHELNLIEKLDLAGYFLIVWDIVRFCREQDILAQGRGSAANSAVCYSLGITAVDPVGMDLLFERFLSEERGEWPDIDLDLPSGDRRERVIQYVYERYGRRGAAMTANVITYRARSAAREIGKALGFPPQILERLSHLLTTWGLEGPEEVSSKRLQQADLDFTSPRIENFVQLWTQIQDLPRHLGQHSGGMVIAQNRLDAVVPLERASMPGRTVAQWDKDDCADLGIIKVDLLGLGMMSVIQDSLELIHQRGGELDLAHLPEDDPEVYAMLQKADTIGVFQVESRAQMATLPSLKPRRFYDLVVEIAIIRPGPIVGQTVHPYLKRRAGLEPVTYPHPSLKSILERTLGVPIFQEQLLRIAMVAAGFSGGEAEELRRTMGFKCSEQSMKKIEVRLRQGMQEKGIVGRAAEAIIRHISSFALYGFPESHSASFALLAYASAYLKTHHPAVFYVCLLNNQPMGFYHPATLVQDAQHHRVRVEPIDVHKSDWQCTVLEEKAMRLGLLYVSGMRQGTGEAIAAERDRRPFTSIEDLRKRSRLNRAEIRTLAEIGALGSFGMRRREALWQIEKLFRPAGPLYQQVEDPEEPSPLANMDVREHLIADYRGTGLTLGAHPLALKRKELESQGVVQASSLPRGQRGRLIKVAGRVIVRQRPSTARGFLFISLEDETGIANIVTRPKLFQQKRLLLVRQPFLIVEGILQKQDNVTSVLAKRFWPLEIFSDPLPSHDFH